ncbi:MAG TPA: hypothetical protein VGG11_19200 [Xanthobacteraceae bacterium]|jgi:hypothetical protein
MKNDLAGRLQWRRDGNTWILWFNKRRMGRVIHDTGRSGMWRSVRADGRLSDVANLSWAKNAVLVAAARELEWSVDKAAA